VSEGLLYPSVMVVVEATREHLLRKSDEIRRTVQVPMLVGPELASAADTGLNFIDNHVDS